MRLDGEDRVGRHDHRVVREVLDPAVKYEEMTWHEVVLGHEMTVERAVSGPIRRAQDFLRRRLFLLFDPISGQKTASRETHPRMRFAPPTEVGGANTLGELVS